MSSVDPALTAEVALRLALVFEASAALEAAQPQADGKSKSGRENDNKFFCNSVLL